MLHMAPKKRGRDASPDRRPRLRRSLLTTAAVVTVVTLCSGIEAPIQAYENLSMPW